MLPQVVRQVCPQRQRGGPTALGVLAFDVNVRTGFIKTQNRKFFMFDACVKSLLKRPYWALSILHTVEDTPEFAFSGLREHFRADRTISKTDNQAKPWPDWPLPIRFHAS